MYLHKYKVGDIVAWVLSPNSSIGSSVILKKSDWIAKIPESPVRQTLNKLESHFKDSSIVEETPEEKEASLSNTIRKMAEKIVKEVTNVST